jgi:hypothetical protein
MILRVDRLRLFARWLFMVCLLTVGAAAPSGCLNPTDEGGEGEGVADTYMSFDEFEAMTPFDTTVNAYVVDGDILIRGRDELFAYYERYIQQGALAVYTNASGDRLWSNTEKLALTYCVSTGFGAKHAAVVQGMHDAASAWMQVANVRFIYDPSQNGSCNVQNNKVLFDVQPSTSTQFLAAAFFPGDPRDRRSVLITPGSFSSPPWSLAGILRHELGHSLGFRHEHPRVTQTDPSCMAEPATEMRHVSSYDVTSVMHYPQCKGTNTGDLFITERDRLGAAALYGDRYAGRANLAYKKPATQSSTYDVGAAARAVDGVTDGNWSAGSVTHTTNEIEPWWQVDLGSVQPVGDVILHNRTDCCAERLANYELRVSKDGTSYASYSYTQRQARSQSFAVNQLARYVMVKLKSTGTARPLSLAEVEVLAMRNLAAGKPTTQSSTAYGGVPARAVDGNQNGNWPSGSVTHSAQELSPWWQVDLGSIQPIGEVVLYNRTDCCAERLSNFKLLVSTDGANFTAYDYPGTAGARAVIPVHRAGRYVKVQLNTTGALRDLSLAEVEVAAARNLARGKVATQSTTYLGAGADRAIDNNTAGDYPEGSVTHTDWEAAPWWQVDLGRVMPVGQVNLYNRLDCCGERLSNFKLMVSEDGASFVEHAHPGVAGAVTTFIVNRPARYVKVQLNNTGSARPFSLAEVEVLAARNLGLGAPAAQSSTLLHHVAGLAVDGNPYGGDDQGSFNHTLEELTPWLQVDLGSLQPIGEVYLHNRTSLASQRLKNFKVMISEDGSTYTEYQFPGQAGLRETFKTRLVGRYVRVQFNNDGTLHFLHLAEVEPYLWH